MAAHGDNPISSADNDDLGRQAIAESLARSVREADNSEGYVLGVVGPWGSGKTSLLNLLTTELRKDDLTVIKFNPWMWNGTDQLVEAFFHELSAQLKESGATKFKNVSATIDRYAELFSPITLLPVVGAWYERAQKVIKAARKFGDGNSPSASAQKDELNTLLRDLEDPIVVLVDDIDRLNSEEIRSLFKLVRLTGNFPNIVYVLAFDRERVESALTEDGIEGRAYLEKIVQHGVNIPVVPQQILLEQLGHALNAGLETVEPEYFDEARWQDQVVEIVLPLVRNMRDVRRYAIAAASTARDLVENVDLGDILSMEAIRVFRPDRFERLVRARDGLTTHTSSRDRPDLQTLVQSVMVDGDDTTNAIMESLINRTFPLGSQYIGGTQYADGFLGSWLRARRMAHPGILSLYLERAMPKEVAEFIQSERVYAVLSDKQLLEEHINSLELDSLAGVISSLESFERDFPETSVVPASTVLLNLIPRIPRAERRGFFDFGDPELRVSRVVLRLLRRLDNESDVIEAVEEILPGLEALSAKLSVVSMVGHREGVGHRLIPEAEARRFEESLASEIAAADRSNLAKEWDLLHLLTTPEYWGIQERSVITDFSVPAFHAQIFRQARAETVSQGMDSRAISRRFSLHWETLEKVYGDEAGIRSALQAVNSWHGRKDDVLRSVLELVEKYLNGWRPER